MTLLSRPAAWRLALLLAAEGLVASSCDWPPAPAKQVAVIATVGSQGSISDAFLPLGDVDTIWAQASTGVPLLPELLCDSRNTPSCFTFSSSDPTVATIDADGVLRARGLGSAYLVARYQNVQSNTIHLTVSPAAIALRAVPDSFDVAVGDSLAIAITALDSNGVTVAGVVFDVGPDTNYWAITSPPREGDWRLETPLVLHLRATLAGSVRLTAWSQNERPAARLSTEPVLVRVHDR
jgi:hypothetical protein